MTSTTGDGASPFTPEQAKAMVEAAMADCRRNGVWNKICNACGASVGGRLAEYGEPTERELSRLACPRCSNGCGAKKAGFRVEFVPAAGIA